MSGIIGGAGSKSGVIGITELDYEEGEWSPVISNAGTLNASSKGRYTKLGRQVTLTMWIGFAGTESGNCVLSGLPFTSMTDGDSAVLITAYNLEVTLAGEGYVSGYLSGGASDIIITYFGRTNIPTDYLNYQDSGSRFFGSVTYFAT